ncbi:MAG: Ferrichrome-iron receptor [uncultured Caballeronia sp.]|nr:MAG: Ferrichrome-iron receptor [uncultured Caballeronia sp.]
MQNLTNKHYYDALIPSDGGRAVPGYGRTFLATLNYRSIDRLLDTRATRCMSRGRWTQKT